MKPIKGFLILTGGICVLSASLSSATAEVVTKDNTPVVLDVSQDSKITLVPRAPAMPTLADLWAKQSCFVVVLGHCL